MQRNITSKTLFIYFFVLIPTLAFAAPSESPSHKISIVEETDRYLFSISSIVNGGPSVGCHKKFDTSVGDATVIKNIDELQLAFPEYRIKFDKKLSAMTLERLFINSLQRSHGYGKDLLLHIFDWAQKHKIKLYWHATPIGPNDDESSDLSSTVEETSDDESTYSSSTDEETSDDESTYSSSTDEETSDDESSFNSDDESEASSGQDPYERLINFYKKHGASVLLRAEDGALMTKP